MILYTVLKMLRKTYLEDASAKSFFQKTRSGATALWALWTLAVATIWAPLSIVAAQETELEEVVVVGTFSRSLQDSLDLKRNSDQIVDAVVSEDIGKWPAANIAEAVQRIPGVSITRERGEGQFLSVRGLGPIFQSVTLNGVPIAFNENNRDSGQSGRQFRFRVLPADLIAGLEVIKSPSANLIDGGIGSNINVRTVNPLDVGSRAGFTLYSHTEDNSGKSGLNGNGSLAWSNADENLGAVVGVSRSERDVQFERMQIERYTEITTPEGVRGLAPNDIRMTLEQEQRERNSLFGGLRWRPSGNADVRLDVLYSTFDNAIREDRIIMETARERNQVAGTATVDPSAGLISGNSFEGGRISRNTELSDQSHENLSVQLGADLIFGDGWSLKPSVSVSSADSNLALPLQRIDGRTVAGADYSYDLGSSVISKGSINNYVMNSNLMAADAVPIRRYRIRPIDSSDNDTTFLVDLEKELDGQLFGGLNADAVSFGVQVSDREREYERRDRTLIPVDPAIDLGDPADTLALASTFNTQATPNAFGDIVGSGSLSWAGFDPALGGAFQLNPGNPPLSDKTSGDLRNSYAIQEEIVGTYIRLDFSGDVNDVPLSGNIGLRYVTTDQTVQGSENVGVEDGGAISVVTIPATFIGDYSEVLPSLNLNFDFTNDAVLRIGASRSLARPSLADLRSAQALDSTAVGDLEAQGAAALNELVSAGRLVGQGGNPQLSPYLSTNVDASIEWYFDEFGALTIAAFNKVIEDFISRVSSPESFTINDVTVDFSIARPRNVGDAAINGIELAYTNRWDFGFGVAASATFTNATIEAITDAGRELQNPADVSDRTYYVAPFFENERFQARISYTWRSEYLRNPAFAGNRTYTQDDFGTLDFHVSYDINDAFSIYVEGVNMTDELEKVFLSSGFFVGTDESLPIELNDFGKTFNVGVRATF